MKKVIFWHICGLNHWKEIVEDQFKEIHSSKLFEDLDKIYITYLGESKEDVNFLLEKTNKIHLIYYSNYLKDYERACLRELKKWSQANDSYVLYIHAKGVSRPHKMKGVWAWRKMLEFILINKYEYSIKGLEDGYDVIGSNLTMSYHNKYVIDVYVHRLFFSGNFWWAKTSYLKNLPDIIEHEKDLSKSYHRGYPLYYITERWILSLYKNAKIGEIYKSKYRAYYDYGPDLDYLTADLIIKEYKDGQPWIWPKRVRIPRSTKLNGINKNCSYNSSIIVNYPNPPPKKY
ncbi:MAG: hypothetical protein EBS19_13515 [Spirochaetia bacterium]|nr:hypothetical protein [Spirochaetia bacterium]